MNNNDTTLSKLILLIGQTSPPAKLTSLQNHTLKMQNYSKIQIKSKASKLSIINQAQHQEQLRVRIRSNKQQMKKTLDQASIKMQFHL